MNKKEKGDTSIKMLVLSQWLKRLLQGDMSEPSFYDVMKGNDFWIFIHLQSPHFKLTVDGVCTKRNVWKYTLIPNVVKVASHAFRLRKYDVVISIGFVNGLLISCIRKLLRLHRPAHIIVDATVATTLSDIGGMKRGVLRWLLNQVDAVITFSSEQCTFWSRIGPSPQKVHFFPLSVDLDFWNSHKAPEKSSTYIFSGGKSGRDYRTLIAAVEQIKLPLVLVTTKNPATGENGVEGVTIPPNVRIIEGVPIYTFRDLMEGAKFVVIPLKSIHSPEGQTVLVEAMAMEKAVIVTKAAGTVDYIIDGETGLFVEAGNINNLKAKIIYLEHNPGEIERLGKNAKRYAEEMFSEQVFAKRFITLLDEILGDDGIK